MSKNLFLPRAFTFVEKGTKVHVFSFVPFSNPALVQGERSANRGGKSSLINLQTSGFGREDTSR